MLVLIASDQRAGGCAVRGSRRRSCTDVRTRDVEAGEVRLIVADPSRIDSTADSRYARFTGRTAWARSIQTPLRNFLRTETGGAAVLLAASAAALVWVNVDAPSYDSVWSTSFSVHLGRWGVGLDLREWVNQGLMTFFFFVVGLEARREFDLGELRERRRFALPLLAARAARFFFFFGGGRRWWRCCSRFFFLTVRLLTTSWRRLTAVDLCLNVAIDFRTLHPPCWT